MLGLNDAWIARNGLFLSNRPGHQKTAPFDYLVDQEVTLVLGHPMLLPGSRNSKRTFQISDLPIFRIFDAASKIPAHSLQVIDIPIQENLVLRVLYLTPHPEVEAAIERHGLKTYPVQLPLQAVVRSN